MTAGKTFSLWLTPKEQAYHTLARLISDIGEKYHSPSFPPHVTLLGSLRDSYESLELKSSKLAARLRRYRINLVKIEYLDEHFRSLFIRVEETKEVLRANLMAREIFDRRTDPEYFPHLSILYGDFPSATKEVIIETLGKEFALSFEVEHLYLVNTSDGLKSWFVVKEFPFGST